MVPFAMHVAHQHPEGLKKELPSRQALARLLERPDAAKLVRATPAQPLFLFLKSLGLEDAIELLALCSTEQVQAFLDMDTWERDRIVPARFLPWIAALCDLGPQKLAAHIRRLDGELLACFLGSRLRIYELSDEDHPPPEEPQGLFYTTPDRFYLVDILPSPEEAEASDSTALLQRFLDMLYQADLELGRAVLQSARWEAGTETEDLAYRFRSGRMADLGYIEYYEALKVYMLLDPLAGTSAQPLKSPTEAPVVPDPMAANLFLRTLSGPGTADCTFVHAAAHLSAEEQQHLYQQLLVLANNAMAADRIELGDFEAARGVLGRTAGYLSLGLELQLLPAGMSSQSEQAQHVQINVAQAAALLRKSSPLHLFRLGYSLTVQLRKLAGLLVSGKEAGLTTLLPKEDPASLLPMRLGEPLRNLLLVRPLYSGYLEHEPTVGSHLQVVPGARPFLSLRDLGKAAAFISDLSTLGKYLTVGLGLRRDNLHETLHNTVPGVQDAQLADLLGTMIANLLLRRPPVFVPFPRRDLPALRHAALGDAPEGTAALPKSTVEHIRKTLEGRIFERAVSESEAALLLSPPSQRLLDETLEALGRSLGALPASLAPAQADLVARLSGLVLA